MNDHNVVHQHHRSSERLEPSTSTSPKALALHGPAAPIVRIDEEGVRSTDEVIFQKNSWTDGLPIVLPTRARVDRMLTTVLGKNDWTSKTQVFPELVPPYYKQATLETAAIAAVMAGCEERAFPLVVAAIEAILDPDFNLHGVGATTMGAAIVLLVSGAAAADAGLVDVRQEDENVAASSFFGAVGCAGNRGCLTVGRAVNLFARNAGGLALGVTECTTLGSPLKISCCIVERDSVLERPTTSASPGGETQTLSEVAGEDEPGPPSVSSWQPLDRDRSVTALACVSCTQLISLDSDAAQLTRWLGGQLAAQYSMAIPLLSHVVVVVSVESYQLLKHLHPTKEAFVRAVLAEARRYQVFEWATVLRMLASKGKFGVVRPLARRLGLENHGAGGTSAMVERVDVCFAMFLGYFITFVLLLVQLGFFAAKTLCDGVMLMVGCVRWGAVSDFIARLEQKVPYFIPKVKAPERVYVVVAGPDAGRFCVLLPGFGAGPGWNLTDPVTRKVMDQSGQKTKNLKILQDHEDVDAPENDIHEDVLDPRGFFPGTVSSSTQISSQRGSLSQGHPRVAFLDISKPQGSVFFDLLAPLLQAKFPNIASITRFTKPTFSRPAPFSLKQKIMQGRFTHLVAALAD